MQAIILAAGRGSRLNGSESGVPKCLIDIDGRPLLDHQLEMLRRAGVTDICVIVGYRDDLVRPLIENRCHIIANDRYAETNSLYSLVLATDWVRGSVLICNCDVLAHQEVYNRLSDSSSTALAFDACSGDDPEHMKVSFNNDGSLRTISKSLDVGKTHGENVGLLKIDALDVNSYFADAASALDRDGPNQWAPAAADQFAKTRRMDGVDITGLPWIEIDYPEDLRQARGEIWPQICTTVCDQQPSNQQSVG